MPTYIEPDIFIAQRTVPSSLVIAATQLEGELHLANDVDQLAIPVRLSDKTYAAIRVIPADTPVLGGIEGGIPVRFSNCQRGLVRPHIACNNCPTDLASTYTATFSGFTGLCDTHSGLNASRTITLQGPTHAFFPCAWDMLAAPGSLLVTYNRTLSQWEADPSIGGAWPSFCQPTGLWTLADAGGCTPTGNYGTLPAFGGQNILLVIT